MGEWSKKIGEYGENFVEMFLSSIGWSLKKLLNHMSKDIESV